MRVIVAGCGYLGLTVARQLHAAKWDVIGLTHSEESASKLAGEPFLVVPCDISKKAAVESFASEIGTEPAAILHCASSGKGDVSVYRDVYFKGTTNLIEVLHHCGSSFAAARASMRRPMVIG